MHLAGFFPSSSAPSGPPPPTIRPPPPTPRRLRDRERVLVELEPFRGETRRSCRETRLAKPGVRELMGESEEMRQFPPFCAETSITDLPSAPSRGSSASSFPLSRCFSANAFDSTVLLSWDRKEKQRNAESDSRLSSPNRDSKMNHPVSAVDTSFARDSSTPCFERCFHIGKGKKQRNAGL